jgi:hypothetical protein
MAEMPPARRAEFLERVKRHIDTMNRVAEEVTEGLGLPPEAKHDVLPVLYREQAPPADAAMNSQGSQSSTPTRPRWERSPDSTEAILLAQRRKTRLSPRIWGSLAAGLVALLGGSYLLSTGMVTPSHVIVEDGRFLPVPEVTSTGVPTATQVAFGPATVVGLAADPRPGSVQVTPRIPPSTVRTVVPPPPPPPPTPRPSDSQAAAGDGGVTSARSTAGFPPAIKQEGRTNEAIVTVQRADDVAYGCSIGDLNYNGINYIYVPKPTLDRLKKIGGTCGVAFVKIMKIRYSSISGDVRGELGQRLANGIDVEVDVQGLRFVYLANDENAGFTLTILR